MVNIDELIVLYNSGLSFQDIAFKIDKSPKWVQNKLRGHITSRAAKRKPVIYDKIEWDTVDDRDRLIIQLASNGDGNHIIGRKLGIDKGTARRVLASKGFNREALDIKAAYNSDYVSGMSLSQIAKKYGKSAESIRYHINATRSPSQALSSISEELGARIIYWYTVDLLSSYDIAEKTGFAYQTIQRFLNQNGLSKPTGTRAWKEAVQRGLAKPQSRLEEQVALILDDLGVDYVQQQEIGEFRFDFGVGDILIEVNGSYWHSKPQRRQRDSFKAKIAREANKKLVIVWDFELSKVDMVRSRIKNAIAGANFDFSGCTLQQTSWNDAKTFLNMHHSQGCGRSGIHIGAFHGDILIGMCVFASVNRLETAKKQDLKIENVCELTRFAINPEYQARNFATWFMSRACKKLKSLNDQIKRIVSFADTTFGHSGTIYRASNWIFDGEVSPSYWYVKTKTLKMYHKKTIWNKAKADGVSEQEFADRNHLIKVPGLKKLRFIYNFKS